jgi:hypothetical protein
MTEDDATRLTIINSISISQLIGPKNGWRSLLAATQRLHTLPRRHKHDSYAIEFLYQTLPWLTRWLTHQRSIYYKKNNRLSSAKNDSRKLSASLWHTSRQKAFAASWLSFTHFWAVLLSRRQPVTRHFAPWAEPHRQSSPILIEPSRPFSLLSDTHCTGRL